MFQKFVKSTMALLLCAIVTANAGAVCVYATENVSVEMEENTIEPRFDIDLPIIKK